MEELLEDKRDSFGYCVCEFKGNNVVYMRI